MKDKEIRKLSKTELLWIIRDQQEEIEELKEEIKRINSNMTEVKAGGENND